MLIDGSKLSEAIKAKGWTRDELAEHSNVSKKTIYNMLAGRDVRASTVEKILRLLEITIKDVTPFDAYKDENGNHIEDISPAEKCMTITTKIPNELVADILAISKNNESTFDEELVALLRASISEKLIKTKRSNHPRFRRDQ